MGILLPIFNRVNFADQYSYVEFKARLARFFPKTFFSPAFNSLSHFLIAYNRFFDVFIIKCFILQLKNDSDIIKNAEAG